MKPRFLPLPLLALLLISAILPVFAATVTPPESASVGADDSAETRRLLESSLRLQQQLQENLAASERARQEAAASSRTNTDALAAQLKTLESTLAERQEAQARSLEKTAGTALVAIVVCAVAGLFALLGLAWAQWRGMNRLATAVVNAQQLALAAEPPRQIAAETASLQLFNALDRLEKRIGELEHSSPVALLGAGSPTALGLVAGATPAAPGVKALIGKGQVLMNLGKHEEALACYENALAQEPNHLDALMKKAAALERLVRLEEALVCYDNVLALKPDFTQAQLAKASVLNQLERFTEALNCFEAAIEQQRATA